METLTFINDDEATSMTRNTDGAESTKISMAEEQDRKAREVNLVIVGIPYHQNEVTSKAVFDNVLNNMHVIPKPKFRAFRLGRGSHARPAPILVQFQDDIHRTALESRKLVMQNKFKMKGTPIWILPDLTAKQRQALPLERQKVQQARKQGLRSELREGVAIHPLPMRKQAHASMNTGKQVIESTPEEPRAESSVMDSGHIQGVAHQTAPTGVTEEISQGFFSDSELNLKADREPSSDHQRATETEGIEVMVMDLPDDVVQKIIAMLPFPAIFKARCLSKSWKLRFSSVANLKDGEQKNHAIYFQNLVGEYSHNWKSEMYWPIVERVTGSVKLGEDGFGEDMDKGLDEDLREDLGENLVTPIYCSPSSFAFDRSSLKWQNLSNILSFLPYRLSNQTWDWLQIDGAIWHWWAAFSRLIVINVFTQSWKLLPPFPGAVTVGKSGNRAIWKKLVMHASSEYEVILFCADPKADDEELRCSYVFHIYNSKSNSWTTGKRFVIPSYLLERRVSKEYLNGVLYMVYCHGNCNDVEEHLLALDLGKGTIEKIQLPTLVKPDYYRHLDTNRYDSDEPGYYDWEENELYYRTLVVCNGNLFMVTQETFAHYIKFQSSFYTKRQSIYHLRVLIDVGKRLASEVAKNREGEKLWNLQATVSDGKSILFRSFDREEGVLEYNVEENRWSSICFPFRDAVPAGLNWSSSLQLGERGTDPFQPGLNTFAVV